VPCQPYKHLVVARHIVKRTFNLRLLFEMASYDVSCNIRVALPSSSVPRYFMVTRHPTSATAPPALPPRTSSIL